MLTQGHIGPRRASLRVGGVRLQAGGRAPLGGRPWGRHGKAPAFVNTATEAGKALMARRKSLGTTIRQALAAT